MAKPRPRIGEKRQVNQPLKIDKFPSEVHQRVQELRAAGHTWMEIEEMSAAFVEWDKLPAKVAALFPEKKLPHSNLSRWYDMRVEQVQRETMERAERARQLAATFAGRKMSELDQAVMNALRDQIFMLMEAADAGSQAKLVGALLEMGKVVAKFTKLDVEKKKLAADEARQKAEQEKREEMDPREIYLQAAQDVLKKLRSRKEIRAAVDPVKEELISEFAHGAEAFHKQI